jgi:hypothetical protein
MTIQCHIRPRGYQVLPPICVVTQVLPVPLLVIDRSFNISVYSQAPLLDQQDASNGLAYISRQHLTSLPSRERLWSGRPVTDPYTAFKF